MAAAQGRGVCSGGHFVPQLHQEAIRRRKQSESIVDLKTQSVKIRTMESVRSSFHAQLATVMDSLLAAAVCEIAKIFESSLCEQQAELVQKTEEIHLLRDKLEKEERRQKTKSGGSEDGETPPAEREGSLILAGSGVNVGNDTSSHQDQIEGLSQNLSRLKEEVTGHDGASVKHECAASRPILGSDGAQAEDEGLAAGDQRQIDTLSVTRAKAKMSHWDQGPHSADCRPLQEKASTPFLSISQSGCCSPRPDPGLTQPREWLSRLDATRGLENLQADGTSCSVPVSTSSGTDAPCFRPGYGPDEASNESDDDSFPFLDQGPVNQDSSQNSAQGQGMGQTEASEDQPQTPSGESPWRPRDDRGGRINISLTRRATTLGIRDPLRPQTLTLRHTNALSHPPAPGGGNVRPYTCPYCTKCFTYPSHQRRHLLRHTGVRLHPCQFCDKSFLTPSELTVHTRTHTGERPFGCAQCGKRFARSGNLRAHQRDVHMGKRPFACTECGKRFAHRGNLRVHNHRVHQGDPYYVEDQQEPDLGPNPV